MVKPKNVSVVCYTAIAYSYLLSSKLFQLIKRPSQFPPLGSTLSNSSFPTGRVGGYKCDDHKSSLLDQNDHKCSLLNQDTSRRKGSALKAYADMTAKNPTVLASLGIRNLHLVSKR